ncbi:hypothetical protein [Pseudomonas nitroreducens]|uniref:Uncharacterized protein n=1 Tax=Pseudomonas nitroreducens TaxID=46680 RepID=A0A6G6IV80_PSENT|nr:hypothetical protein [Pseudomonas nitroreducens]QIE87008.1 hypothetical protein G5B91_12330 [Pseudomonas nitroreducens]
MQVNPQEVSTEKATTPAADLRLVSVEQLQKIHRELDACQKVIWLAGCGQRGYGFDPAYVIGAQEQLKGIEALLAEQPAEQTPPPITCEQIQEQMTGGGCPTAGSLGECAAIWRSGNRWTAALYIWDADFNDSTTVAKWFQELGARDVFIGHTLYDTNNGDRNGEVPEGGARQWLVEFSTREVPHA